MREACQGNGVRKILEKNIKERKSEKNAEGQPSITERPSIGCLFAARPPPRLFCCGGKETYPVPLERGSWKGEGTTGSPGDTDWDRRLSLVGPLGSSLSGSLG